MRYMILGLLLGGPLSLYDLHKRFTAGMAQFYSGSIGGIRRALTQLVVAGWATVEDAEDGRRGKREYTITPEGKQAWREWMQAPLPPSSDSETMILAKVFLLGWLPEDERVVTIQALHDRVSEDAKDIDALLQSVDSNDIAADERDVFDFQRATLEYGAHAHRLLGDWLAALETPGSVGAAAARASVQQNSSSSAAVADSMQTASR
ncbi:PadR family transcriptional regulator [Microbacterium sp.]|uniref:PadR family transcriptional regulator n=1 Tax=Microbacterium sp. TaxID=51671 RepID=UPI00260796E8|nr:PadR family transcriptional regulator [Microbacterium sp.]